MINIDNNDRIIGDFLEINADIEKKRSKSKLPKFIANMQSKIYRKKLLNKVTKLRNSNYILTTENLIELFNYVYISSNMHYKSIQSVTISNYQNIICLEALIVFDNCKVIINIDQPNNGFDISISEKIDNDNSESCNIHRYSLEDEGKIRARVLNKVNKQLLNDICDFICDTISLYDK